MQGLTPDIEYEGEKLLLLTTQIVSIAVSQLKDPIGFLEHFRDDYYLITRIRYHSPYSQAKRRYKFWLKSRGTSEAKLLASLFERLVWPT